MKQLRLLTVSFDTEIKPYETPAFRGAIIEKVGIEHEWFHNHNNDPSSDQKYHYRYPLVQYKRDRKKPMLVFINEGVEEAQRFFVQQNWDLTIGGRFHKMSISHMHVKPYDVGVYDRPFHYTIRRWQALNKKNYQIYQSLENLNDRVELLNKILANHLISFAKGISCKFEQRFEVQITDILNQHFHKFEGVGIMVFTVRFQSNVLIPPHVGLGKGVSQGYGVVTPYSKLQDSFR